MKLLRNNKIIHIDASEDDHRGITAVKQIDIKSTLNLTKDINNLHTPVEESYELHYHLDGYMFINPNTRMRLTIYCDTIGDAISAAIKRNCKVFNSNNEEITL